MYLVTEVCLIHHVSAFLHNFTVFFNLSKFLTIKIWCFSTLGFNICLSTFMSFFPPTILQDLIMARNKATKKQQSASHQLQACSASWPRWGNLCITCFFPFGFSWFLKLPTIDYVRSILLILPLKTIPGMSNLSNSSWTFFCLENSSNIKSLLCVLLKRITENLHSRKHKVCCQVAPG